MEPDAEEAECHHTHTLIFHELGRMGHLLLSLSTREVEGQISLLNIREVIERKIWQGFSCKLEGETGFVCVFFKRTVCVV